MNLNCFYIDPNDVVLRQAKLTGFVYSNDQDFLPVIRISPDPPIVSGLFITPDELEARLGGPSRRPVLELPEHGTVVFAPGLVIGCPDCCFKETDDLRFNAIRTMLLTAAYENGKINFLPIKALAGQTLYRTAGPILERAALVALKLYQNANGTEAPPLYPWPTPGTLAYRIVCEALSGTSASTPWNLAFLRDPDRNPPSGGINPWDWYRYLDRGFTWARTKTAAGISLERLMNSAYLAESPNSPDFEYVRSFFRDDPF